MERSRHHNPNNSYKQTVTMRLTNTNPKSPFLPLSIPKAVLSLTPSTFSKSVNQEGFTLEIIEGIFQGKVRGDGLYCNVNNFTKGLYPVIRVINTEINPLAPQLPREHGAMVTYIPAIASLKEWLAEKNQFPLFAGSPKKGYKFMGLYREPSPGYFIGKDELKHSMPQDIKKYWARALGGNKKPKGCFELFRLKRCFKTHKGEMISKEKAQGLGYAKILKAFDEVEKSGTIGSMAMEYVFLEAVSWDDDLYATLLRHKNQGPDTNSSHTHSAPSTDESASKTTPYLQPMSLESLARIPICRSLKSRDTTLDHDHYDHDTRVLAAKQMFKRGPEAHEKCGDCTRGDGIFEKCVIVTEGAFTGSCVNCWAENESKYCSLFAKKRKR